MQRRQEHRSPVIPILLALFSKDKNQNFTLLYLGTPSEFEFLHADLKKRNRCQGLGRSSAAERIRFGLCEEWKAGEDVWSPSQCVEPAFSLLLTVLLIQSEGSLPVTALEKHLCPQSWPAERLSVLWVWRNGGWLTSAGKRSPRWCPGSPLPSCAAVRLSLPPGADPEHVHFRAATCPSSPDRLRSWKKNAWPFRQAASSDFLFWQVSMKRPFHDYYYQVQGLRRVTEASC